MTRDLSRLASDVFDVLVIGAGIHGAFVAWDAVLRGCSVAVVERGDFCGGTSANSLKTIHGGLRYLQGADFRRMRASTNERSTFLRLAPHLVQPLPFLAPTHGLGTRGTLAMRVALRIADLVGFDRNRGLTGDSTLPAGRVISRRECLRLFPGCDRPEVTGGALWFDALATDTERLVLSVLIAAAERGAVLANRVASSGPLESRDGVHVVPVDDLAGRSRFDVRARTIVNTGGPWAHDVNLALTPTSTPPIADPAALALNLVVGRRLVDLAVGVRSPAGADRDPIVGGGRTLFMAPWRHSTLVGTAYAPAPAGGRSPTLADVGGFIDELNEACPSLQLSIADVTMCHWGRVPLAGGAGRGRPTALADSPRIVDHGSVGGPPGLVTVVGVKYTTARRVAALAVDVVARRLGRQLAECRTATTPIYGTDDGGPLATKADRPPDALARLRLGHGRRAAWVASRVADVPRWHEPVAAGAEVLRGEVVHAVRDEMALTLGDVVFRRTGAGTEGEPPRGHLVAMAELMGGVVGWDGERCAEEVEAVRRAYAPLTPRTSEDEGAVP